jgi:Putative auto-transporter adhesin, head GIN domain
MNSKALFGVAALVLAALACSTISTGTNQVIGSGHLVTETRTVGPFASIELDGSADVKVTLGTTQSVTVEADDNILPLIETTVTAGKLVVGTRPLTNISTRDGVRVTIVTTSLKGLKLSGSGNIDVAGMTGPDLSVELPGSGNITISGAADQVTIDLQGSGNVFCNELRAHSATVTLNGSGNVKVYADQSLDAKLSGSGTIRYEGNPARFTKSITGSGSITP